MQKENLTDILNINLKAHKILDGLLLTVKSVQYKWAKMLNF